ncbi:MAG: baseplate J/gp47 family protein, partial [Clostridia bacterium]|nr:baseplate J/gp47 family protein [Clostridia bacterium]
ADRTGSRGNALAAGAQMQLAVSNAAIASIVVSTDAAGGNEAEDDDTYRARIQRYGLAAATTGTSEMYERIAKETSSEIIDAKALNEGDLDVYVYLILEDGANAASIISAVTAALSPKDARPLSDNITVAVASEKTYTLNVNYSGADTTDLATAVADAVAKYQSWQDEIIGQPFNPDRLKAYMYQAGCSMVTFAAGSNFDGGTVEYTEIEREERCKGTITLTAVSA